MRARIPPMFTIAAGVICFSSGAFAVDGGRPHHPPAPIHGKGAWSRSANSPKMFLRATNWKLKAAWALAADRNPYADPIAPYKADRLSSHPTQTIIDIPGQTTVLTRRIIDDKNATTLRDALGTTPGVTIRR
jgi:hypothetical protein